MAHGNESSKVQGKWFEHDADKVWWGISGISRRLIEAGGIALGTDKLYREPAPWGRTACPVDRAEAARCRRAIRYGIDSRADKEEIQWDSPGIRAGMCEGCLAHPILSVTGHEDTVD